jgi:hypothetical protein
MTSDLETFPSVSCLDQQTYRCRQIPPQRAEPPEPHFLKLRCFCLLSLFAMVSSLAETVLEWGGTGARRALQKTVIALCIYPVTPVCDLFDIQNTFVDTFKEQRPFIPQKNLPYRCIYRATVSHPYRDGLHKRPT